jgi:Fe-S cluster assembly protein SufD
LGRRQALREAIIPFTIDDVVALSERLNEPEWMLDIRLAAWELAESMPMPTTNDEPWRRTDIRAIHWDESMHMVDGATASLDDVPAALYSPLIGEKQGGLLVYDNGKLVHHEIAGEIKAQGVIFSDLGQALETHPDLVRQYFMTEVVRAEEGKFAALHAALWTHGIFVYVPAGVQVELPLHSVEYLPGTDTTSTHILCVVEEGASATYLHESASPEREEQTIHSARLNCSSEITPICVMSLFRTGGSIFTTSDTSADV